MARIDIHITGFARPERDVIERDFLLRGTSIDDSAHGAVADDEGFLEKVRWTVIPQCLSFDRGQERGKKREQKCDFLHIDG